MNGRLNDRCPRCGQSQLRSWSELNDEERAVVIRLPGSADFSSAERQSSHRWCTRCWYEVIGEEPQA